MRLRGSNLKTWLQALYRRTEAPNKEQRDMLEMMAGRCHKEAEELRAPGNMHQATKPERACLLGIPGAGKSACIKWIIEFFTEGLGWEPGVQFQCVASQNTMAALIGGKTLHHWGGIPVNATDAAEKISSKGSGGDADELYERCLGMRWLLIDEVSTLSPMISGPSGFLSASRLQKASLRPPDR